MIEKNAGEKMRRTKHMERDRTATIDKKLKTAVEQIRNGEESGFGTLYSRTYRYVYSKAKFLTGEEQEALDLMQEVYLAAYKNIGSLKNINSIYAWLGAITLRQSSKLFRKNKRNVLMSESEADIFEEIPDRELAVEDRLEKEGEIDAIRECISKLSEEQRAVVLAYYYEERRIEEIADILDVSEGTVKSRLYLARKHLRASLTEVEKKQGYKLYSICLPAVLAAIGVLSSDKSLTVQASQCVYADTCTRLGIQPIKSVLKELRNFAQDSEHTRGTVERAAKHSEKFSAESGQTAAKVPEYTGRSAAKAAGKTAGKAAGEAAGRAAMSGGVKAAIVALCILGAAAAGVGGYFWYSSVQTAKKIEALEAENKRLEEESAKKAEEQAAAKEKEKEEETVEETGEETAPEPVEDTGTETQENTPEETVVNFQDVYISILQTESTGGMGVEDGFTFWGYYLYDMDNNGIPELIIHKGYSGDHKAFYFYSYDIQTQSAYYAGSVYSPRGGCYPVIDSPGVIVSARLGMTGTGNVVYLENKTFVTGEVIENFDDESYFESVGEINGGYEATDYSPLYNY